MRKALSNTRGETLLEGIISILIFTVLIAAITMILTVSMRITATSFIQAGEMQDAANAALAGVHVDGDLVDDVIFNINIYVDDNFIQQMQTDAEDINIRVNTADAEDAPGFFVAFAPDNDE